MDLIVYHIWPRSTTYGLDSIWPRVDSVSYLALELPHMDLIVYHIWLLELPHMDLIVYHIWPRNYHIWT